MSLFLSFFFQPPAHHGDLHSFPTRRSSDLAPMKITALSAPTTKPRSVMNSSPVIARSGDHGGGIQDRKSTRLNSSHRCISYAVFCLKKKKKIETAGVVATFLVTYLERLHTE